MLEKLHHRLTLLRGALPASSQPAQNSTNARSRNAPGFEAALNTITGICGRSTIGTGDLVDAASLADFIVQRSYDRSQRILSTFVAELPAKMTRLAESIREINVEEIRAIAHSARGSSLLVGAAGLARESRLVEDAIVRTGTADRDAAARLAATMTNTCALYREIISAQIGAPRDNGNLVGSAT